MYANVQLVIQVIIDCEVVSEDGTKNYKGIYQDKNLDYPTSSAVKVACVRRNYKLESFLRSVKQSETLWPYHTIRR